MPSSSVVNVVVADVMRCQMLDSTVVAFNSASGRYFILTHQAEKLWSCITNGKDIDLCLDRNQELIWQFQLRGLLEAGGGKGVESSAELLAGLGFVELTEFNKLILEYPEIDRSLLGPPVSVKVTEPARRRSIERVQIRKFVESIFAEATEYVDKQKMLTFSANMYGESIAIKVPVCDSDLRIPLQEAFLDSRLSDSITDDYEIVVIDEALWPRNFELGFDSAWHFPLGVVNHELALPYRIAVDRHTQSISVLSPRDRKCVVWMPDYRKMPYWAAATPLRLQLSWIADSIGAEFIHAAAIKVGDRAVLFAGPSGSGKSTLALCLAKQGYPLLCDDFLVAHGNNVQAIYRRLKVHDWSVERVLPQLWRVLNSDSPGEKRIVDPGNVLFSGPLQVAAIVIPVLGDRVELKRISAGEAFSRMAPASLSGLLGGNFQSLQRLGELASNAPCFTLTLDETVFRQANQLDNIMQEIISTIC